MSRGRIPEAFLQELLARTDIVALIGARVELKRAGREYTALCPFHAENTPSFTVSPHKQFYHCFGCKAHGSALGFLMEFEGLEFLDAVDELARAAGMEVPRVADDRAGPSLEPLYAIVAEAEQYFRARLREDQAAVRYLQQRGLSGEIAKDYRIGFAPAAWQGLSAALGTSGERRRQLEQAGLVSRRDDGGCYDKFRGRIMFPIHDTRGRPVAFGGRIFGEQDGPKYLNSPETPLFHKGRLLYGLHQARKARGRPDRLVVVEGYMDVLALAQHGLPEAVATLGTATTREQAQILFRSAPEIVFCFDGDRAGRQAAERALEAVIPEMVEGRQVRFLFLPDGEDPDSLLRQGGAEVFADRLARAVPFSEYFFGRHQAEVDMRSLEGRAALVARCRPWIARMPEGTLRQLMLDRLGELSRSRIATPAPAAPGQAPARPGHQRPSLLQVAIRSLVHAPGAAAALELPPEIRSLERPGVALLCELHDWARARPEAHSAQLLEAFREHPQARALALLAADPGSGARGDPAMDLAGALLGLQREALRAQLEQLKGEVEAGQLEALARLTAVRSRLDALGKPDGAGNA